MYTDFFTKSDTVISHLKSVAQSQQLQFQPDYSGFICIIAVATYEMAIKNIFFEFCNKQHVIFGEFFNSKFSKLNGNISIDRIKSNFLVHFGQRYTSDFDEILDYENKIIIKQYGSDIINSYKNIITLRHSFAHSASFTYNTSLNDVYNYYIYGKYVIQCLDVILI